MWRYSYYSRLSLPHLSLDDSHSSIMPISYSCITFCVNLWNVPRIVPERIRRDILCIWRHINYYIPTNTLRYHNGTFPVPWPLFVIPIHEWLVSTPTIDLGNGNHSHISYRIGITTYVNIIVPIEFVMNGTRRVMPYRNLNIHITMVHNSSNQLSNKKNWNIWKIFIKPILLRRLPRRVPPC